MTFSGRSLKCSAVGETGNHGVARVPSFSIGFNRMVLGQVRLCFETNCKQFEHMSAVKKPGPGTMAGGTKLCIGGRRGTIEFLLCLLLISLYFPSYS